MSSSIEFRRGVQRFSADGREWVPAEDFDRIRNAVDMAVVIAEGSTTSNSLPNIARILRAAIGSTLETSADEVKP